MSLDSLREEVLSANLALPAHGLVTLTWGNASAIDRERGVVVIKPSGVAYTELAAEALVVLDLDGNQLEGERRPSTDAPTHLQLYRSFEEIGGVVHTHSTWATVWAQANREIPLLGTTHADLSPHPVPLTRELTAEEVRSGYEEATGSVLVETISRHGPAQTPCALVRGHAPFCWGTSVSRAIENAVTLEEVARMAWLTTVLEPAAEPLPSAIRNKHFERKHGPHAYYGQP